MKRKRQNTADTAQRKYSVSWRTNHRVLHTVSKCEFLLCICADSPWEERRSKLYHGQKGNEEAQRVHKGNQEAQRGQKGKHEAQRWNSNDFGLWRCANFCCKFTDRKALDIMTIIYHMLVLVHSIWNCQSSFLHRTSKTLVKSSNWTPKASLVEPVPLPC